MTWSAEELVVRAYAAVASAVQAVLDGVTTVERLTRPPVGCIGCGKTGCGEKCANAAYYRGAEELAEREAEEGVGEADIDRCYFGHHPFSTCVQDCQCTEAAKPSEQCRTHHPLHPDWLCTKPFGHEDQHGYAGCFWTESPLTDDELIGVRGLLQERYEDDQPIVGEWRFTADELDLLGLKPGERLGKGVVGQPINSAHSTFQTSPSVNHTPGIDGEPTSPAAGTSATGDSGEAVSGSIPPESPASPRHSPLNTGQGPTCLHHAPHYVIPTGQDHQCYCARPQDHPLDDYGHRPHICPCGQLWADLPSTRPTTNAEQSDVIAAICEVLITHYFYLAGASSIGSADHCLCGNRPRGVVEWNKHVATLIAEALVPQPK